MAIQAAHFEALLAAAACGTPAVWDFDAPRGPAGPLAIPGEGYAADAFEFSVQRVAQSMLLPWSPALQACCVYFAQHMPHVQWRSTTL